MPVSATDPSATILMATRNRARHLPPSLSSVLESSNAAPFPVEVLVINNASNDETPEILRTFANKFSTLRVLDDPIPGKSGVINRGIKQARGRAIVFTDDDVHVPRSWVADMAGPILDGTADAVCGLVELAGHLDRSWLSPYLRASFAEVRCVSGELPGMVGASMAASREAAAAIGFDEELGPGARGFADDVLFNLRLKAGGYRLVGSKGPAAEHHFDPDRLTYLSMRSLAQRNGSSHAYLWHHWLGVDVNLIPLRRLRAKARLLWASRHRRALGPNGISEAEYLQFFELSFFQNFVRERSKPRAYRPL